MDDRCVSAAMLRDEASGGVLSARWRRWRASKGLFDGHFFAST
jgi:hypothetical protein